MQINVRHIKVSGRDVPAILCHPRANFMFLWKQKSAADIPSCRADNPPSFLADGT